MRYSVIENDTVINIAVASEPLADTWQENQGESIGDTWDGTQFVSPPAPPVELGQMEADKHEILSDSQDTATVSITAPDTVHFVVDGDLYSVEPENDTATLEITADAPGPIRVEMQGQSLMIVALEVSQ